MAKHDNYPGFRKMLNDSWKVAFPETMEFDLYYATAGPVRTAETIAVELWKLGIPAEEFAFLKELQRQLTYLHKEGSWDYRGYNCK